VLLSVGWVWAVPLSTQVIACGTLGSGNYYLTQDVSSDGTCFTIAANSVTLDCKGYTISYSQTDAGDGIDINGYNSTTVKNCNIIQDGEYESYGIAIELSYYNTITNNTVTNTNNFGIALSNSSNNTFADNTVTTTGNSYVSSIYLEVSSNNTFTSNNITGTDSFGIYITEASGNNTLNNNIIATTGSEVSSIYLENSSDSNTLTGNTITGEYCLFISYSADNLFYNNFLNGTVPVSLNSAGANYWNTTLTEGTNIVGGLWIGGNFYAQPDGNGFSQSPQNCLDDNLDILCDSNYGEGENMDYLPLAQPQPVGEITGTVLNPSGDPVTGANVHAEDTAISTTTNASGEYTLTLLVGIYTVTVSKDPIYIQSSIYEIEVNESEATQASPISLQYSNNMGCGGSAAIAGYVRNSTGGSIEGASIYVYPQMSGGGMQGGEGGKGIGGDISNCYGSASSDANGSYFVFALKAGIYTISVSPPYDSDYGSKDARDIIISGENETVSYNATLSLGGKIFGKIINSSGSGLPNMDVYAYTMSGEGYGSTQTQNGCSAVSSCSVFNNNEPYCSMGIGCYFNTPTCEGTPSMSCSDIPTICSGTVQCDSISEEPSCLYGCEWNTTAHCDGTPNSCGSHGGNMPQCTAAGCEWHTGYCGGEPGCDLVAPGDCTPTITPGCDWVFDACTGDPTPCNTYSIQDNCTDMGCTWDAADCQGSPNCSSISTEDCSGVSGCSLMNEDCMQLSGSGCALNNYCMGTPTASCGSYGNDMDCMNSGMGCSWDYGSCGGTTTDCSNWIDPDPEIEGDEYCEPICGCDGWDWGSCTSCPGCEWNPEHCYGEPFGCGNYSDPICANAGCSWLPVCESDSGLSCMQDTKEKCDIVTGCTYGPYCSGTPACEGANESTCVLMGCSWDPDEGDEGGCIGTPTEACAGKSPCDLPGCYWNSDPCQGEPSNGWQCDQLQAPDQMQCEMIACAWNASNVGKFMIKGLMLGTYSIQAQPQYWLQPPSEYASKIFTENATINMTIAEEGDIKDVGNLTLGTAGVLKGCVTDSVGNPVPYAYLNAYSMDAGFGWAQTQPQAGCIGTPEYGTCEESYIGNGNYCQEGIGCTWYEENESCEGTINSCDYYSVESSCDDNSPPGCTWDTAACYRITGLTTGTYTVEAYSPWYLSLPRTTVGNVAVKEGEETELNIKFGVSSSIYGYIQNATGGGVPDVYFNIITEGAGPYSPSEDWGWGMAQTVGCVRVPDGGCNEYCSDDQDCCDDEGCAWNYYGEYCYYDGCYYSYDNDVDCWDDPYCAWNSGEGYCYDQHLGQCGDYHTRDSCNNSPSGGCSWDNRAFYNVSGLKGSETRKYVVIAMPGYYNWYHNTSYSQKVNSSVTLPVGGSVEVNFTMTTGGSISGRVVDGNNNSINAGIGSYMPYSEGQMGYGISGWARTNASGSYNITGLPAGTYEVQAYPWSGGFTSGHATVTVGEGEDYNLNFTLGAGGRISGRIIENGSAISSAIVEVWSQDASVFAYGSAGTGSDGTFLISGLDPADDYSATIRKVSAYGGQESPTYISGISVVADQTTELGDILIIPVNGGIYGNATYDNGSAIANAYVYAWSKDTMAFGWAQTNGSGYYDITGLPGGTYDAMLDLWSFGLSNQFTSVEVGTDPVLHNFGLAAPASIYGYVTSGGPVSGAKVNVWNSNTSVGMSDTTDSTGLYNITIDSGTGYSISIIAPGYETYFNDSVDLTSSTELDIVLTSMSGSTTYTMQGNVTYANGTGISGASIVAYGGETASYFTVTDNSGAFTIISMQGGLDYNVTAIVDSTQSSAAVTADVLTEWTDANGDIIRAIIETQIPLPMEFSDPTPSNGDTINTNHIEVNASVDALSLSDLVFNWDGTNYRPYNDSLVLAMNFNNNSAIGENGTKAVDISRYGNNGTINGATWTTDGKFGSALSFDGANDYVSFSPLNLGTNYSLSIWVKSNQNPSGTNKVIVGTSDSGMGILLDLGHGGDALLSDTGSGEYTVPFSDWKVDEWQHFVVSRQDTNISFYVDGAYIGSADTGGDNSPISPDNIGGVYGNDYIGPTYFFNGTLDEVRVWNRPLSADEVGILYQSELQKYNSTQYRFYDELTGLGNGDYTYYVWANDTLGISGQTDIRALTIMLIG
jgi:parallel beta-helix repeat protein